MPQLRQNGNQWNFYSELELEEFIWIQLNRLFEFLPIKRQYSIKGQFCDILAVTQNRQLVVIELKNEVDRYVVQQLTRYYHALKQEQPFSEQVDYSQPIRLIAIAPSFHRDNLIDQQYNQLSIEFLQFEIVADENGFVWKLHDRSQTQNWSASLPYPTQNSSWEIPSVPRKLLNNLANVEETHRDRILRIRRTLLEFDPRMKETVLPSRLVYGKGKTRLCAAFCFGSPWHSLAQPKKLNLLLRLPHPDRRQMCRMFIDTPDWTTVERLCYSPDGRRVQGRTAYWQQPMLLLEVLQTWGDEMQAFGSEHYRQLLANPDCATSIDLWVRIALEHWAKATRIARE
jgi:RecB family endonuclease NucS